MRVDKKCLSKGGNSVPVNLDTETLFVKFKVDPEMMEQVKTDSKGLDDFIVKNHEQAMKKFTDDSKKATEQLGDKTQEVEKKIVQSNKGISNSFKEIGDALGINLAKFATMTGVVLSIVSFMDQTRKALSGQILATSMLNGASGTGSMAQAQQYGAFQTRMRGYYGGVMGLGTEEEVAKASAQLMTTRGNTSQADLFGKGGMVEQSLLLGRSTGMGSETVAQTFSNMISHLGMDARKVGESFTNIYEMGRKVGNVNGQYIKDVMDVTMQLRSYNVSLDQAGSAIQHFWKDIDRGKMSIQDIVGLFTMGRGMSEGQAAFIGNRIMGSELTGKYGLGGASAITMQGAVKEILEGSRVGSKNVSPEDRVELIKNMAVYADTFSKQLFGKGGKPITPEEESFGTKQMLSAMGYKLPDDMNTTKLDAFISDLKSGNWKGVGGVLSASGKTAELNALEDVGKKIGALEKGPLDAIEDVLKRIANILGAGFMGLASYIPGMGKYGDFIRQQVGATVPGEGFVEGIGSTAGRMMSKDPNKIVAEGQRDDLIRFFLHGNAARNLRTLEGSKNQTGLDEASSIEAILKKLHITVDVHGSFKDQKGNTVADEFIASEIFHHADLNGSNNVPTSYSPAPVRR